MAASRGPNQDRPAWSDTLPVHYAQLPRRALGLRGPTFVQAVAVAVEATMQSTAGGGWRIHLGETALDRDEALGDLLDVAPRSVRRAVGRLVAAGVVAEGRDPLRGWWIAPLPMGPGGFVRIPCVSPGELTAERLAETLRAVCVLCDRLAGSFRPTGDTRPGEVAATLPPVEITAADLAALTDVRSLGAARRVINRAAGWAVDGDGPVVVHDATQGTPRQIEIRFRARVSAGRSSTLPLDTPPVESPAPTGENTPIARSRRADSCSPHANSHNHPPPPPPSRPEPPSSDREGAVGWILQVLDLLALVTDPTATRMTAAMTDDRGRPLRRLVNAARHGGWASADPSAVAGSVVADERPWPVAVESPAGLAGRRLADAAARAQAAAAGPDETPERNPAPVPVSDLVEAFARHVGDDGVAALARANSARVDAWVRDHAGEITDQGDAGHRAARWFATAARTWPDLPTSIGQLIGRMDRMASDVRGLADILTPAPPGGRPVIDTQGAPAADRPTRRSWRSEPALAGLAAARPAATSPPARPLSAPPERIAGVWASGSRQGRAGDPGGSDRAGDRMGSSTRSPTRRTRRDRPDDHHPLRSAHRRGARHRPDPGGRDR